MNKFYTRHSPQGLINSRLITGASVLILKEAKELGISATEIPGTEIIEMEYQGQKRYFYHQVPPTTTALGLFATEDKHITKNLLLRAGIQVPHGYWIRSNDPEQYWLEVFHALKKPLVVKPTHGTQGYGITVDITSEQEYRVAMHRALEYVHTEHQGVVVEELFKANEYRILTTTEKVIGIVQRRPASVLGDGEHSIEELIAVKNQDPRRGEPEQHLSLNKIKINDLMMECLAEQNLTLSSVPNSGERIQLRKTSNISQGGDSIDMTDHAHESVKEIAIKALEAVPGIEWAGIDFMTLDITRPQTEDTYKIIELNASPGIGLHDIPYEGKKRYAVKEFLYTLFPALK